MEHGLPVIHILHDQELRPADQPATFHLLGMREENKNNPNFQTMPNQQQGQQGQGQQQGQQQPITPRHMSQTMNVSATF